MVHTSTYNYNCLYRKTLFYIYLQSEGYRPHAASTYLTDHLGGAASSSSTGTPPGSCSMMGGIYSVEQGREIGFSSSQLPLTKYTFAEDTESQYADELRRQAYIQTLGRYRTLPYTT